MPLDQDLARRSFEKLKRQLAKISSKLAPTNVHRFRTSARRVEVLLDEVLPEPSRNDNKLVKLLARSRKKAGRVRDLDMQISLLGTLKFPQAAGNKARLLRSLIEKREKAEKKLRKALDRKTVAEMRWRLRKTADKLEIPPDVEPLETALQLVRDAGHDGAAMTEEMLHQYRIAGKRARYVAELDDSPRAERVAAELKRMQDVIGEWHDWLQLTAGAEKLFGKAQDSSLVAELSNVTRAKFREAAAVVPATRAALRGKPAAMEVVARKRPASTEEEPAA